MKKYITHCALYCGLCAQKGRIPETAETLLNTMKKEGYEYWGSDIPGFDPFWRFLKELAIKNENNCRDNNCGYPGCPIRKCAQEKKIDICIECDEYPCDHFDFLIKRYPHIIPGGKRMKEIGYDAWIEEQNERYQCGFQYCDTRLDDE